MIALTRAVVGATLFLAAVVPAANASAELRVLHAAPDVPAVTVYVDGKVAVANLKTLAATPYLALPAGTYHVAVSLAGQPASKAALKATITLKNHHRYTAVARGLLARKTLGLALQPDRWSPPRVKAALRVWHLSPDAPNVDVLVDGKKVLQNVSYKTASGYLAVPAGTYAVRVDVAGTQTAVFSARLKLKAGTDYSAVALGAVKPAKGAKGFRVSLLTDL